MTKWLVRVCMWVRGGGGGGGRDSRMIGKGKVLDDGFLFRHMQPYEGPRGLKLSRPKSVT